jgi:hypothetical protein
MNELQTRRLMYTAEDRLALVVRSIGDRLQWLDRRHPAVVQQGERPRVRRHVQPPPHRHGGTPRLLRLRRKPIRWEVILLLLYI